LTGRYQVVEAGSELEFREEYRPLAFDLLLLDMRLRRDREGLDVLREVFAQDELQPVIMMSAYGDTESAIEAVASGAMMFLHKQEFSPALLGRMVEAVIEQGRLRRQVRALRQIAWAGEPETLLGNSAAVREAAAGLRIAAEAAGRVPLVVGERGTGTSLAARVIHRYGARPDGPFLEVEGRRMRRDQHFFSDRFSPWIQATWGTLALDGVERIEEATGRSLLEHLQTQGSESREPRVVFLLHEDPNRQGKDQAPSVPWLSTDATLPPVRLPPLRERREDIPLLAAHFLQAQRAAGHTPARSIGAEAMERLETHGWPGNVRELRNAVEYAALQTALTDSAEVGVEHLPAEVAMRGAGQSSSASPLAGAWDYRRHLAHAELDLAERAIRERGISQKARLVRELGYTDRFTLARRIQKALAQFPDPSREFPAVARLFPSTRQS